MLDPLAIGSRLSAGVSVLLWLLVTNPLSGQSRATVSVETRTLETYGFSDPNPLPTLLRDDRLYPYHSFEGYAQASEPREWTVVTLENEWLEVWVLPEIGGKVWGARVKETGHEFVYRNEVVKFRNIALRGPWTSGGIEFNFGLIGHTPATATPVDYLVRDNEDGSASVFVGAMDLPSRTRWRVEVRLPADAAYFETRAQWQNPTPLEHPYYNWMTGAAFARDDLVLSVPGNAYLGHPGERHDWPVDSEGRTLTVYDQNRFGGNKSYHVVGRHEEFFGGYYADAGYGFGHWARYEDMPGQKIWLWALSRQGGIWEDLLTDTDGQYVEFQAGRLFVQYSPGDAVNPISEVGFHPGASDRWTETWFPVEGLGGLSDASRDAAMFVSRDGESLTVRAHAFVVGADTLVVTAGPDTLHRVPVEMDVLQPLSWALDVPRGVDLVVAFPRLGLRYATDPSDGLLSRPFETSLEAALSTPWADRVTTAASELVQGRRLSEARQAYGSVLAVEPWHRDALLGLADLEYRRGRYRDGLPHVRRALQLDAYDAEANFVAGNLYRAVGSTLDAREAFGWAARAPAYRSVANRELAEIAMVSGSMDEAIRYARLALDYDRYSLPALHVLAVAGRLTGDSGMATDALDRIALLDPLSRVPAVESWLARGAGGAPTPDAGVASRTVLGLGSGDSGEYSGQELVELGLNYARLGRLDEATRVLALTAGTPVEPVAKAWIAYSTADTAALPDAVDVALVFPFRREMLPALEWAHSVSGHWSWSYLHGLALWGRDRPAEAAVAFDAAGDEADYGPFFATRAALKQLGFGGGDAERDFTRAIEVEPGTRLLRIPLIQHLQALGRWEEAVRVSERGLADFPGDFDLALLHSRNLNEVGRYDGSLSILDQVRVLPSEHSAEAHQLFAQAHVMAGLAALERGEADSAAQHFRTATTWPERLGQGRPYEPEERLPVFLLGLALHRDGDPAGARDAWQAVVDATPAPASIDGEADRLDLLGLVGLELLGRSDALRDLRGSDPIGGDGFAPAIRAAARAGRSIARVLVDRATASPERFSDLEGRLLVRAFAAGASASSASR